MGEGAVDLFIHLDTTGTQYFALQKLYLLSVSCVFAHGFVVLCDMAELFCIVSSIQTASTARFL